MDEHGWFNGPFIDDLPENVDHFPTGSGFKKFPGGRGRVAGAWI